MIDRRLGTSLGCVRRTARAMPHLILFSYGFIDFSKPEEAAKAIAELNGRTLENKRLKVSYARPPSTEIQNANLYVSNLGPTVTTEMLQQVFCRYGKIIDCKVLTGLYPTITKHWYISTDRQTGIGRGVGFVRFNTHSEAENAVAQLNNTQPFPGMQHLMQVKFAENLQQKQRRTFMFPASSLPGAYLPQLPMMPPGMPPGITLPGADPAVPGVGTILPPGLS